MKQVTLSTRTFGKTAKQEALKELGQPYRAIKAGYKLYKLVDKNGNRLGHVDEAKTFDKNATLYIK